MDKTTISVYIDFPDGNSIDVELRGYVNWENDGIGSYECHGNVGYDEGTYRPIMDNFPDWDKKQFTEQENIIVKEWLEDNEEVWTDLFEKQALADGKPDKYDYL